MLVCIQLNGHMNICISITIFGLFEFVCECMCVCVCVCVRERV